MQVDMGEPARLDALPPLHEDVKKRDESEVVKRIMSRVDKYKKWRESNVDDMWEKIYQAYMGYPPATSTPYQTTVVIREIFRQMEVLKAQMASQFFGGPKPFRYLPKHYGFEGPAQAAANVVMEQIKKHGLSEEHLKWLDNAPMYGVSYLCYGWQYYRHMQHKPKEMHADPESGGSGSWFERETKEIEEAGPTTRWLNHWDCYTAPFVEDPRNSPFFFYVEKVSGDYLKTRIREGYLDADRCKKADPALCTHNENSDPREGLQDYDANLDFGADGDDAFEMLTCWSSDGWEYVILNGTHLVRGQECYYKGIPILCLRNYPKAGEHYGIPEPLLILGEQKILNDMMGMYVDIYHFTSNPMFLVPEGSMKYFKKPGFKPGGIIPYEVIPSAPNMGKPELMQVEPREMNLSQDMSWVRSNMQLATGLTPELAGTGSNANTATQHVSLRDAAGERMRHKVRTYMPRFRDLYDILFRLNAAFLDSEVAVRMEGDDGKFAFERYGPDVFAAEIDVEVELSNEAEQGPEAAMKWQNAYKIYGQDPLVNRAYLIEKGIAALGVKNPKHVLVNPTLSMQDAMREYRDWLAYGIMAEPKDTDNHQKHLELHQMQQSTPEWQAMAQANPSWAPWWNRHVGIHSEYVKAQQEANAQMQQQSMQMDGSGGVPQLGNQAAEQNFNNGMRGAMQEGEVPAA